MLETFAALFAAHVAADYLGQTRRSVARKHEWGPLALHVAQVFALAAVFVGFTGWAGLAALTLAHGAMDIVKARLLPPGRLWPYMLDQGVHVLTLVIVAALLPGLVSAGLWAQLWPGAFEGLTTAFLIGGFGVFAVRAGGFAVELLLRPFPKLGPATGETPGKDGAPSAGELIGQLERGLTFLLMLIGQPVGIAFLIATKSILRFEAARDSRAASEYVIIGTLASVGWAMLTAAVLMLLLPEGTLESLRLSP